MTKITTQQILVMTSVLAIIPITSAHATTCIQEPCCDPLTNPLGCKISIPEYDFDFRVVPICDPRVDPSCPSCPVCLDDYKFTEVWKNLKLDTKVPDKFDSFNTWKLDSTINKFQKP